MPDEQNDNYSLLLHPDQQRALLLQEEHGWTLPRHSSTQADEINAAMLTQLGLTTTVLGCVYDRYQDEEREDQHRVYALENHSPGAALPDNGRWIGRAELAQFALAVPEHRAVLEGWFAQIAGDGPAFRKLPWMRPGWFAEASAWIDEQLGRLGAKRSAPIEQMAARPWGAVLRVPTSSGHLYFKAPAAAFAFEPALAQTLARLVPDVAPAVVAIDQPRSWLLMEDGGKTLRSGPCDPPRYAEALRQFAQMQMRLAGHVDTLKAAGCPDQRLSLLPSLYDEVLADTPLLLIDEPKGMPRSEYEQLLAFGSQLREMCDELASYDIPESLHSDDLHTANILVNGEKYRFIDAAECCLAHPFCTLFVALRVARYALEYDEAGLEALRQAYLLPWTDFAPMERLQRALALAHRLGSLYKALNWYRLVTWLPANHRWVCEDSPSYFLRVFLGAEE
ncbi:MAG TPA: hypothetical protein VKT82_03075 [Ktedonobacterales bacterium]|nr:hypothetical protein [Ktedonobacterales bacterium]